MSRVTNRVNSSRVTKVTERKQAGMVYYTCSCAVNSLHNSTCSTRAVPCGIPGNKKLKCHSIHVLLLLVWIQFCEEPWTDNRDRVVSVSPKPIRRGSPKTIPGHRVTVFRAPWLVILIGLALRHYTRVRKDTGHEWEIMSVWRMVVWHTQVTVMSLRTSTDLSVRY